MLCVCRPAVGDSGRGQGASLLITPLIVALHILAPVRHAPEEYTIAFALVPLFVCGQGVSAGHDAFIDSLRPRQSNEVLGISSGLYFFHNARARVKNKSGIYLYLPKMESHLEARLWNEVFVFAQRELGVPQGSVKATVLIETILAAFEMEAKPRPLPSVLIYATAFFLNSSW